MLTTRRAFLKGSAAAGLVIAFHLDEGLVTAAAQERPFEPNAYLRIGTDDTVTVWVTQLEMGQGVRTVLPMILAEELDADWARVRIEQAWPGGRFKGIDLHTSGSSSTSDSFNRLRRAGAAAREMLIAAAAAAWSVDPASCRTEPGVVVHPPSNRRRSYGSLAAAAAALPVPEHPALKPVSSFRIVGQPTRRVDGPAIVTGRAGFGLDVRIPGMLFASIERAPTLGASLRRFDSAAALKLPGVRHVVPVTRGIQPGVAVVADDTWTALQGRAALTIEWAPGSAADFDSDWFLTELPRALDRATFPVRHEGDAIAAIDRSSRRHEATYVFPFQAHAPIEPMNCTAHVRADAAEVWIPTQTDVRTLQQVAKTTGLPGSAITVHCTLVGGGFGRRLFADFAAEAAELSKATGAPVQVMWTRADDMRHGYFQPATAERLVAGLSPEGAITGLHHRTSSSDLTIYEIHDGRNIWTNTPAKPPRAADSYAKGESPWGAFDNPYEFPNLEVICANVTSPVPVGPWRAVEYPSTVFARESFLDELAHLSHADPIAFRLTLLPRGIKTVGEQAIDRQRLSHVLDEVRRRARWSEPLAARAGYRRGRGVAANVYHAGSYLAMVAEVSIPDDASEIRVDRLVTVVDCGLALNPLGVAGQTESGITWGLSATLLGKMDFRAGAPVQSSYRDFRVIRIDQMPELETVIVPSTAAPGGFGEHPVPLVAPAVANAVFAATGQRLRQLPLVLRA